MKFEGPPSPFIEPTENRYKNGDRAIIEDVLAREFRNTESVKELANEFLSVPDGALTSEELEQFRVFAIHGLKRNLNAQSQKYQGLPTKSRWSRKELDLWKISNGYDLHDLSHVVGSIIEGRHKTDNPTLVSPFLQRKDQSDFNIEETFIDELYGSMWGVVPHLFKKNTNMALYHLAHAETKAEFIKEYIEDTTMRSYYTNEEIIEQKVSKEKERLSFRKIGKVLRQAVSLEKPGVTSYSHLKEARSKAKRIIENIRENPPEKAVELLTYIWEHRENPRVLADLFFREVGPYTENLQKRKVYQPTIS